MDTLIVPAEGVPPILSTRTGWRLDAAGRRRMLESAYFYFESKAASSHGRKAERDLAVHAGRVHDYVRIVNMLCLVLFGKVSRYLFGTNNQRLFLNRSLKCDDAPEEEAVVTKEPFAKLDCHISSSKFAAVHI